MGKEIKNSELQNPTNYGTPSKLLMQTKLINYILIKKLVKFI